MIISAKGLKELQNYKYQSGGYTPLDNYLDSILWTPLVKQVPMWVSANLITFVGFMSMIGATIVLLVYDYRTNNTPPMALLIQSLAIFVYQTLDAIDGKQARRTNSSSILGQLFDHGCDAAVTTLFIIGLSYAVGLTGFELFLGFMCTAFTLFGVNQWETHSGVMYTNLSGLGVTEAHYLCILVNLISTFFGSQIWHISIFTIKVYQYILYVIVLGGLILTGSIFQKIFVISKNKLLTVKQWLNIGFFLTICWSWTQLDVFLQLSELIVINFGFLSTLMLCKLIICSKSKEYYPTFHHEQIPFFLVTLLQWILQFQLVVLQEPLFWVSFLSNLLITVRLLNQSINQITSHLNINCFIIKKKN